METLSNFLINISEIKRYRTCIIAEKILDNYNYKISSDNLENDIRIIVFQNNNYDIITIISTIILDSNLAKKEYIEIKYNKYWLKFSVYF